MTHSLLARYESKAKTMSAGELLFAIADIKEVMTIWRDDKDLSDPYIQKLYAEFDAYTVELFKIRKAVA